MRCDNLSSLLIQLGEKHYIIRGSGGGNPQKLGTFFDSFFSFLVLVLTLQPWYCNCRYRTSSIRYRFTAGVNFFLTFFPFLLLISNQISWNKKNPKKQNKMHINRKPRILKKKLFIKCIYDRGESRTLWWLHVTVCTCSIFICTTYMQKKYYTLSMRYGLNIAKLQKRFVREKKSWYKLSLITNWIFFAKKKTSMDIT